MPRIQESNPKTQDQVHFQTGRPMASALASAPAPTVVVVDVAIKFGFTSAELSHPLAYLAGQVSRPGPWAVLVVFGAFLLALQ